MRTPWLPTSRIFRSILATTTLVVLVGAFNWLNPKDTATEESANHLPETLAAPSALPSTSADPHADHSLVPSSTSTSTRHTAAVEAAQPDPQGAVTTSGGATATTTAGAAPLSSGTRLTGDICTTVNGVATLVGNVSLECDLVVSGPNAVLVARSGMDLDGNGFQILFEGGASADFQGTPTSTWSNDGLKQNRARDVTFRNVRRIMFHDGAAPSVIKFVAVVDSGTAALGDYPLHWHLNGDASRGTLVEGVVVERSAHHAFVPHGSHGITFRDTIAFDIAGEAYWWDPPGTNGCNEKFVKFCTLDNSNDITYDHVLADTISNRPGDNRGFTLAGFEMGAGSGNVARNSVARNINPSHTESCSGFHWPSAANQNVGGSTWVFEDNATFDSKCHGIFVWQNDNDDHVVKRFRGDGINHGAYTNRYDYRDTNVPYLIGHAVGWTWSGGSIGVVKMVGHVAEGEVRFTNVDIGSFVVSDGGGDMPATYILDGTGLSCSQIVYENVKAGSKVVIDDVECSPSAT